MPAFVASAAVAVVGSVGHHATSSVVRLQGLRQMEFNECAAGVVGHDGSILQVCVTQGQQHTPGWEIRVKRTNVMRVERPTTNTPPPPQPHHNSQPVGAEQPTVPHTGGKDPVADMPDTVPGNWYYVMRVRYPGAATEEIKRAYKQLSVKVAPRQKHTPQGEG